MTVALGAAATIAGSWTDGVDPADPDTLSLVIDDPAGNLTTLAWPLAPAPEVIDHPATGSFQYVFTPDQVGIWRYRWSATGAVTPVVADGSFEVESAFTPTYATLDRALALFETTQRPVRQARLAQALQTATDELVQELNGRDFFRHPDAGTATWSPAETDLDGPILHCHQGIFAVASITVRGTALGSSEYLLRGSNPYSPVSINEPAFHVQLLGRRWPRHVRWDPTDIVIVSATGYPSIPAALAESCAMRARQIAYGDGAYQGVIPGPDGDIPAPDRWPQVFYRFMVRERGRFAACLFANDTFFAAFD